MCECVSVCDVMCVCDVCACVRACARRTHARTCMRAWVMEQVVSREDPYWKEEETMSVSEVRGEREKGQGALMDSDLRGGADEVTRMRTRTNRIRWRIRRMLLITRRDADVPCIVFKTDSQSNTEGAGKVRTGS